jgi:hypothetical protein
LAAFVLLNSSTAWGSVLPVSVRTCVSSVRRSWSSSGTAPDACGVCHECRKLSGLAFLLTLRAVIACPTPDQDDGHDVVHSAAEDEFLVAGEHVDALRKVGVSFEDLTESPLKHGKSLNGTVAGKICLLCKPFSLKMR